jgi:diadenosine tetraphosphate (Ap4A) HIT family hydrolase
MFELHPRLAQDCITLGRFPLSRLMLMNESRFPWFVLVPEREGVREIFELAEPDRIALLRESCDLSRVLKTLFSGDKVNVAAIGNLVPQLHLHHVIRCYGDPAWPAAVWGRFEPLPYPPGRIAEIERMIGRAALPGYVAET